MTTIEDETKDRQARQNDLLKTKVKHEKQKVAVPTSNPANGIQVNEGEDFRSLTTAERQEWCRQHENKWKMKNKNASLKRGQ